ncbi:MAG: superoxide dismutase [Caulobacteraceae bacterium]|nr:superoxide dismutase [Caulobacteraceae bacterium]
MFILPELPYAYGALAPTMSEETLRVHHDKHHATYVKTLNELIEESGEHYDSLESVVVGAEGQAPRKLYNNAAQAWNHAFFWQAMSPQRPRPDDELAAKIEATFGGMDELKTAFIAAGADHFGSGWVWLAAESSGALSLVATHDADNSMVVGGALTPLMVCDVWEHAYYLDYKNDRRAFLAAWFDALPNWRLAGAQLAAALGRGERWRYPPPAVDVAKAAA